MTLRILWGSPLPPIRSGISDYAVHLLPELVKRCQVRVLAPPGWTATPEVRCCGCELVDATTTPERGEISLIHLGNNPYHEWLMPRLRERGVVAVLHDAVVHHLLVEATLGRDRRDEYESLLESAHGSAGRALAKARRWGLTGRRDPFLFPARRAYLGRAAAVVVHSRWAREAVERDLESTPVRQLAMPMIDPGALDRRAVRADLDLGEAAIVLMHLGFVSPQKGLREVLTGITAALDWGLDVHLVQVGEAGRDPDRVRKAALRLGIESRVHATGWVSAERVAQLPSAADLGVVLRTPSAGETSAAAVRFLAAGTPFAVSGLHQYLEWPETLAPRLTPGPAAGADLARLVAVIAKERRSGQWEERRRAARQLYEADHRPATVATRLVELLEGL